MILNIAECDINYDVDIDQDELSTISHVATIPHHTKDKWVVIKAAETPIASGAVLTDDHFHHEIITRIKIDEDKIWLVPLAALVAPCYVIHNKNYYGHVDENDICEYDSTAYVVKAMCHWADIFMK